MYCIHILSVLLTQIQDFDEKVVNKMALLVDKYGEAECFAMLDNLANRMRTKQVCGTISLVLANCMRTKQVRRRVMHSIWIHACLPAWHVAGAGIDSTVTSNIQ